VTRGPLRPPARSARARPAVARALLALALAGLLAGCGGSAGGAGAGGGSGASPASGPAGGPAAPARPLRRVSLALPWLMTGYDAAFVVARDRGYYRAEGLDVTLVPGKNSLLTTEGVAGGHYTFGFADAGAAAAVVSRGGGVKVLACLTQTSPTGLAYNPGTRLASARDLEGRTIIANNTGGPVVQMLFAVLDRAGIPHSAVHLDLIAPSAVAAAFKAHPRYLLSTFVNASFPQALKLDPRARFVPYSKFGVNTLSLGLIAADAEIRSRPDLVRGFVAASLRGWAWTAAHPKAALDLLLKDYPEGDRFIWGKSLDLSLPLAHTPATQGRPLGWMAASDWNETLAVLHRYSGLKVVKPLADYYTNSFLPK
jgi:NitT/TauT family transport system substrate-binding protein